MPVTKDNIRIFKSESMTDQPEGGGSITAQEVISGQANNIYQNISELDRVFGTASIRKLFMRGTNADADPLLGANLIISKPTDDPNVSATLFSTRNWFDTRAQAVDALEKYLAPGTRWPGQLLERQLQGQRSISLLLQSESDAPGIGRTLLLVGNEGAGNEYTQYVRVTDVSTSPRNFTVQENGQTISFTGVVALCDISNPLTRDFDGPAPSRLTYTGSAAVVRDTVVADAATYCGITKLAQSLAVGAFQCKVASIFTQLVPSGQQETPLVNLTAGGSSTAVIQAGTGVVTYSTNLTVQNGLAVYAGGPIAPGTLSITRGTAVYTDVGGQLRLGGTVVGTVDYPAGVVRFTALAGASTGATGVSFKPAVAPLRVMDSAALEVTAANRGSTWVLALRPLPKPKALRVSFRAQGRWYELFDTGTGALQGLDPAFGVGSIDYGSGTAVVTTGALPDVGSVLLFQWGAGVDYTDLAASWTGHAYKRHALPTVSNPNAGFASIRQLVSFGTLGG